MTRTALAEQVSKLKPLGLSLYEDMTNNKTLDMATKVLALQAARQADRLNELDRQLNSREVWLELGEEIQTRYGTSAPKVNIVVDNGLSEARQQALALSAILQKLGVGKLGDVLPEGKSLREQLADARAERNASPAAGM